MLLLVFAVYPIICAWALWRGDAVLRIAAVLALASTGLGLVFPTPDLSLFPVDITLMLAMMALSLWSRRLWTLPAGALMIDRVAVYAFRDIDVADTLGPIWAFGLLLCLIVGIINRESRRMRTAQAAEVKSAVG
ncbi:hypothetical protein ABAC460_02245 [Asticcacaulis sp. AC460]|uniref:hypothetical protein n=1 Tax=Asticcacaulis sp. AC460 TaxID=1282360 RepID=UPI0003C3E52C|nr:hypothetical protein [Asticcacaulis sp. AC460]ESQ93099.1 hypothetical protein ABAC460_02245 [Asticcacaulis sp. AC460]